MVRKVKISCSLFWLLFSVVISIESLRLPLGEVRDPGAGLFPLIIAILTGVLATLALVDALRERPEPRQGAELETAASSAGPFRWWNLAIIFLALIVYALTLSRVGFFINTFWFMLLLLKVIDPQGWIKSLVTAVITAAVSTLLFNVVLDANIPQGILGF